MGGAVLAQPDGIVRPDVVGIGGHERTEAHGGVLVLREDKEGTAVDAGIAVQRNAVHDGGHGVFTNTEVQVAAIRCGGPGIRGDGLGAKGLRALDHRVVGACQVGGAAPHLRQGSCQCLDGALGSLARCQGFARFPGRKFCGEVSRQLASLEAVEELLLFRVGSCPRVKLFLPLCVLCSTASGQLAGVRENFFVDVEGLRRIEAEDLLGGGYLILAEGCAVDAAGVHLVRCRVTNHGFNSDEGGAGGFCAGSSSGRFDGFDIFAGLHGLHVPAIGLVTLGDVLVEGNVGVVLNGDSVVIPEDDEIAQLLGACQRRSLSGDALLQVTVGGDDVNEVIEG